MARQLAGMVCVVLLCGAGFGCGRNDSALMSGLAAYERSPASAGERQAQTPAPQAAPGAPQAPATDASVPSGGPKWFMLGTLLTASAASQPAAPADTSAAPPSATDAAGGSKLAFTPWRERRGPAYPERFWVSFGRDAKEMPATLWDDTKATFTNPLALVLIGAAGASGIVLNASGVDDTVAERTEGHRKLNRFWDNVGDVGGNPGTHFAFAGAMYFTTLAMKDTRDYEVSKTLLNALVINGLTTVALKVAVRTDSPNGDPLGWPSGHTSSTFALATVLGEAYGPWAGVPLFGFAGFVGYERIDARNHDFTDVISGMLLGVAIGHAVSQNHEKRIFGLTLLPYADPETGTMGLALGREF